MQELQNAGMASAKREHVPLDEVLRKLNEEPGAKDKFWRSPSTFFEEELGIAMSAERKGEIDALYGKVERQARERRFRLPFSGNPEDPCI